jgi:hypothetical protein
MPKVENNNLLHGVSGKLGNNIVIRQSARGTVMANKPKKAKSSSEDQIAVRNRFSYAAYYAREQMKRDAKALYEAAISARLNSGYAVAMSDYLTVPRIDIMDTDGYHGSVGDVIKVRAWDDFKVKSLTVVIKGPNGEELERGDAIFSTDVDPDWIYTVRTANPTLAGSSITAIAKDIPGNAATKTLML